MARLHEYQSKAILRAAGIVTPRGAVVQTVDEARDRAVDLGGPVVVKAQAWVTGRAGQNLIRFAASPEEAAQAARDLLDRKLGKFPIDRVLVEEKVAIEREFYLGLIVDGQARAPVVIFSSMGGTGVEEIARLHPDRLVRKTIDIRAGLRDFEARDLGRRAGLNGKLLLQLSETMTRFYNAARSYEARSAEINPLALTADGQLVALDARFVIDDYAVFRHPDLAIDVPRDFDHPPTRLEQIAWQVEKDDYRGTFYFIQLMEDFQPGNGIVGFHGAGGGGSMVNMDALLAQGFQIADFVDTSGNPPASKVYRAARIILSQPGIDGYYAGGSGVASQEQFHSARGLVKAFMDAPLNVPAVIRLGGNAEEQAIAIVRRANGAFPAPVEAYGRADTPETCAARLRDLIDGYTPQANPQPRALPPAQEPYQFETVTGGTVTFDHALCRACASKICVETCVPKILALAQGVPVLNIAPEEARRGGCTECLACEVECAFLGNQGGRITLPIPGLTGQEKPHANPD